LLFGSSTFYCIIMANLIRGVANALTQAADVMGPPKEPQPWKSSIFDCFKDIPNCCMGFCCPCVLFGMNQRALDGGDQCAYTCIYCAVNQSPCLVHYPRRQEFRRRYHLQEDLPDLCASWCCSPCAICQESREMKARGSAPVWSEFVHPPPMLRMP